MYSIIRSLWSLWGLCFIVLFVDEVSPKETVERSVGSFAVLPCYCGSSKLQTLTAHWRYNDIKNVYDIQGGKGSAKEQDSQYSYRTSTFSSEIVKGNFSLKLENLRLADAGEYCCYIPDITPQFQQCTSLYVKERSRDYQGQVEPRNRGAETKADTSVALLIPFLSFNILLCI